MKQVILIHGLPDKEEVLGNEWPSPSNSHWFPWVQKQLTRMDILCQTPEMPRSYDPVYIEHENVLNQFEISKETVLVGHSSGGVFLLRYFSEHKDLKPKKVILVAPWLDLENYLKEIDPQSDYFDFKLDEDLSKRISITCLYSTDDDKSILDTVQRIKNELPEVQFVVFDNRGHFTEPDLDTKEFPEIVDIILK